MDSTTAITIVLVVLVSLVFTSFATYIVLAFLRARHPEPRHIPTRYLKRRWRQWNPQLWKKSAYFYPPLHDDESVPTLHLNRSARTSALLHNDQRGPNEVEEQTQDSANGVDRHISMRSVMTLPAYSRSVRENEEVLGREGERAGIDVVIEAPETLTEEEARREEEMASLYQIRAQRRREVAEREERRERRRDARERQDYAALRQLQLESTRRAREREISGTTALIAEHQSHSRDRRVSSVSYGDLGVARHDGTRIRAGSVGSDRQPLLDSAASFSGQSISPAVLGDSLGMHARGRSTSSFMSGVSSDISDSELDMPPFGRSGSAYQVATLGQQHSRGPSLVGTPSAGRSRASSAAQRPSIDTSNLGQNNLPPAYNSAGFEDAPPYISPATERAEQSQQVQHLRNASGAPMLPEISRLPSIRIAEATPIETSRTETFPTF